jgi:hypothetical protein
MDWPLFVGHMHFIEALASILKSSPASSCPVSSGLIDLFLSEASASVNQVPPQETFLIDYPKKIACYSALSLDLTRLYT